MQKRKNMGQVLMFIYIFNIFLSLILVEASKMQRGGTTISCNTDDECPHFPNYFYRCLDDFCHYMDMDLPKSQTIFH
ncbi:unnamed protein product [Lathyrus oleraceus]